MFIPDLELSSARNLPRGTTTRAVGWLGSQVPSLGETPPECIDRLLIAYGEGLVFREGGLGPHSCEICTGKDLAEGIAIPPDLLLAAAAPVVHWRGRAVQLYGHGHYLVCREQVVYMTPALVLHYILDHRYRPPDEFVVAVVEGSFLNPDDPVFHAPYVPAVPEECALLVRLTIDLKAAMKAQEPLRVSVLRVALSETKNAGHRKTDGLTDQDVKDILRNEVEKREEAAALYRRVNQPDRADKELAEAAILRVYIGAPDGIASDQ